MHHGAAGSPQGVLSFVSVFSTIYDFIGIPGFLELWTRQFLSLGLRSVELKVYLLLVWVLLVPVFIACRTRSLGFFKFFRSLMIWGYELISCFFPLGVRIGPAMGY